MLSLQQGLEHTHVLELESPLSVFNTRYTAYLDNIIHWS